MGREAKISRTEIDEPAYFHRRRVMPCVVRNISPEGADIDVENPAFVPSHFRLVMARMPRSSMSAGSPGSTASYRLDFREGGTFRRRKLQSSETDKRSYSI